MMRCCRHAACKLWWWARRTEFWLKFYVKWKDITLVSWWCSFPTKVGRSVASRGYCRSWETIVLRTVTWTSTSLTHGQVYRKNVIDKAVDQWRKWLHACKKAKEQCAVNYSVAADLSWDLNCRLKLKLNQIELKLSRNDVLLLFERWNTIPTLLADIAVFFLGRL